jgi:hypothetical protein
MPQFSRLRRRRERPHKIPEGALMHADGWREPGLVEAGTSIGKYCGEDARWRSERGEAAAGGDVAELDGGIRAVGECCDRAAVAG